MNVANAKTRLLWNKDEGPWDLEDMPITGHSYNRFYDDLIRKDMSPLYTSFSPDSRICLFVLGRDQNTDTYSVLVFDTEKEVDEEITRLGSSWEPWVPVWHPPGHKRLTIAQRIKEGSLLYDWTLAEDLSIHEKKQLPLGEPLPGNLIEMVWDPSGEMLAIAVTGREADKEGVYIWEASNPSNLKLIAREFGQYLTWAPSGKALGFFLEGRAARWLKDDGQIEAVGFEPTGKINSDAAWSPDETRMAVATTRYALPEAWPSRIEIVDFMAKDSMVLGPEIDFEAPPETQVYWLKPDWIQYSDGVSMWEIEVPE